MTLTEILTKNARDLPDKTALAMRIGYRTLTLSYRDVYQRAAALSSQRDVSLAVQAARLTEK